MISMSGDVVEHWGPRSRQMTEEREMTDKEHEEYLKAIGVKSQVDNKPTEQELDGVIERFTQRTKEMESQKARDATRDLVTGNVSYILAVIETCCDNPNVVAVCNKKLAELRDLALKG